jgi:hypothetical protein
VSDQCFVLYSRIANDSGLVDLNSNRKQRPAADHAPVGNLPSRRNGHRGLKKR